MIEHSDLKSKNDLLAASTGRLFHKVSKLKTNLEEPSNKLNFGTLSTLE